MGCEAASSEGFLFDFGVSRVRSDAWLLWMDVGAVLVELYEEVLLAECLLSTHAFVAYGDVDPGIS